MIGAKIMKIIQCCKTIILNVTIPNIISYHRLFNPKKTQKKERRAEKTSTQNFMIIIYGWIYDKI